MRKGKGCVYAYVLNAVECLEYIIIIIIAIKTDS